MKLATVCGDSRIDPELLTGSGHGENFVERNPGNIVPIYDECSQVGVSASIKKKLDRDLSTGTDEERLTQLTKLNVLQQMKYLESHPAVVNRRKQGLLTIEGWTYEIHSGMVESYNSMAVRFEPFP